MMFGTGDVFAYLQCGRCGCLQIAQIPRDPGKYYPPTYYSFNLAPIPRSGLKSWMAAWRDFDCARGKGVGRWLAGILPPRIEIAELGRLSPTRRSRMLDVGCGQGQLLSVLHRAGFRDLLGVDPFLPADVEVAPGLWVRRLSLKEVQGRFDLIMLHHVFEHLEDGAAVLSACRRILAPEGKVLLRMPIVECKAWERYQENWVAIDAPRHYFLHTRRSLKLLVESAGFRIAQSWCDSTEFQFWASELYARGIPLFDTNGRATNPDVHFTAEQIQGFRKRAQEANAANCGDQAAFVLVANSCA